MGCPQCIRVVREDLTALGLRVAQVALGVADVAMPSVAEPDYAAVRTVLQAAGFELLEDPRAQLADRLLASLSAVPDLDEAWSVEAERRLSELESGNVIGVPIARDGLAEPRESITLRFVVGRERFTRTIYVARSSGSAAG